MTTESNIEPKTNIIRRFPLISFFVLSYLFFLIAILIIWAIVSLTPVSETFMGLLIAFGSWTPNLAAVIITSLTKGKSEVKILFMKWLKKPVNM